MKAGLITESDSILQQVMILDNLHAFGRTEFPQRMPSQRSVIAHSPL
jgi:hypothetical protein